MRQVDAGIVNTGFAFSDYDHVWKAMDGSLGHLRLFAPAADQESRMSPLFF